MFFVNCALNKMTVKKCVLDIPIANTDLILHKLAASTDHVLVKLAGNVGFGPDNLTTDEDCAVANTGCVLDKMIV